MHHIFSNRARVWLMVFTSLFFGNSFESISQQLTTSNLPIIIIDTNGQEIPGEPKIPGTMKIIDNADIVNDINDFGLTALHIACRHNASHVVRKLTTMFDDDTLDLTARSLIGLETPLHLAAVHGHAETVIVLLEALRRRLSDDEYNKASRQYENFQRKLEQLKTRRSDVSDVRISGCPPHAHVPSPFEQLVHVLVGATF